MEENPELTDRLLVRIKELALTYIELLKLKAVDSVVNFISGIIPDLIIAAMFVVFLFFLNLGLALWLGELFGRVWLGFFALAGFYLLLGFASRFIMRGWLRRAVAGYFIRQIFR